MWSNLHILKKFPNAQPPHKVRRISKVWLVFARKVELFNFQKQTAVLNYESDCCLLSKQIKLSWPAEDAHFVSHPQNKSLLQDCALEMLVILCGLLTNFINTFFVFNRPYPDIAGELHERQDTFRSFCNSLDLTVSCYNRLKSGKEIQIILRLFQSLLH